jgi:hypothetical protein
MNKNRKKAIAFASAAAVAVGILICGVQYSDQIKGFVSIVVSKIKIKES